MDIGSKLFAATGFVAVIGIGAVYAARVDPMAVALGQFEFVGGTASLAIDGAALAGGGGDCAAMIGRIANRTGAEIREVTVSIRREGQGAGVPTFGSLTVGDVTTTGVSITSAGDGRTATVALGTSGIPAGGVADFRIADIDAHSVSEVTMAVSAAIAVKDPDGDARLADVMEAFELSPHDPSAEHALAGMAHERLCAEVRVTPGPDARVTRLDGRLAVPAGSTRTLDHVAVLRASDGSPLPGAKLAQERDHFSVTGVALTDADAVRVIVVLSGTGPSERVRLTLEASFVE